MSVTRDVIGEEVVFVCSIREHDAATTTIEA